MVALAFKREETGILPLPCPGGKKFSSSASTVLKDSKLCIFWSRNDIVLRLFRHCAELGDGQEILYAYPSLASFGCFANAIHGGEHLFVNSTCQDSYSPKVRLIRGATAQTANLKRSEIRWSAKAYGDRSGGVTFRDLPGIRLQYARGWL